MSRFFLGLVAIGVATLIGAFVIAAFRLPDPFLRGRPSLRTAPTQERTLAPPLTAEPSGSPAGRFWPGVDYPAISANRGDGRRPLTFEPAPRTGSSWSPVARLKSYLPITAG
jgi:hypothetical protein